MISPCEEANGNYKRFECLEMWGEGTSSDEHLGDATLCQVHDEERTSREKQETRLNGTGAVANRSRQTTVGYS